MTKIFPFLFLVSIFSTSLPSQPVSNPALHQLLLQGIDQSGQQRYSEAKQTFDRSIAAAPNHPAGYLNKAILFEVMSLDFETPTPEEFLSLLETAKRLSEAMIEKVENSWEGHYYLGMVHSYIAYYKFRDGKNWLSGLTHGLKASGYLGDCVELNPRAYDAFTGRGTYLYWKSRKMSFLTWTPFVSDESAAGIFMLREAEKKATYTSSQASNSLIWIFIDEEKFSEAESIARAMLKKYPMNRLFLWGLASALEKQHKWKDARETYEQIVRSIDSEVIERRYIEVQARAKIALMSYEFGDMQTAKREGHWVLSNASFDRSGFTSDGEERIEKRVREVKKMFGKMQ